MKFSHKMPFGTEVLENGVIFRLYAPDVDELILVLNNKEYVMDKKEQGFFEIFVRDSKEGDRYGFKLSNGLTVPDSASKYQPEDVHELSEVVDSNSFDWENDVNWNGIDWEKAVFYELHVGTFSSKGTFKAVEEKLDYLKELGITAVEIMPVSDFPGKRGWGYDGVLPFAPESSYGKPEDLKNLIKSCHEKGIAIFLDVVYNHFGPDGNYLYCYAKNTFFDEKIKTPWGEGINFDNPVVRKFFINNALYWLKEYRFDGLRLDAVHAIPDTSFIRELAERINREFSNGRKVHLVVENDDNASEFLSDNLYKAQWNDDFHHVVHIAMTGEKNGYYEDYVKNPLSYYLSKVIAEGFAYQGEVSVHREGRQRGHDSKSLNPSRFINFIQNHDQVGNMALGERINKFADKNKLKCITALYLLMPSIPMVFMGEEWHASTPFLYFCDFEGSLADAVRNGRRHEFSKFPEFSNPEKMNLIPDPNNSLTFESSKLNWDENEKDFHKETLEFYKKLLKIRKEYIVPIISRIENSRAEILEDDSLKVVWVTKDGQELELLLDLDKNKISFWLNKKDIFLIN